MKTSPIFAVALILAALLLAGCEEILTGGRLDTLRGSVTITASSPIPTAGDMLTANYNGSEPISYQWKRGSTLLGTEQTQVAEFAGSYTVTINAPGFFNSRTSDPITVFPVIPDLTYSVTQDGGEDGSADSTGIKFTFSSSADRLNLTAADITVSGAAVKAEDAELTGTGKTRILPITVNEAGTATVTITLAGIDGDPQDVIVYQAGAIAPGDIDYTLAQIGGVDGTTDSTGIQFTFDDIIDDFDLTAGDIEISGAAEKDPDAEFTGSGSIWTLSPIIVNTVGQATVRITKDGIDPEEKKVLVLKEGEFAPTLTGITLNTDTVKKDYNQNERLSLNGLIVTAQYSSGSPETVTNYTSNPANGETLSTVGTRTVIISYTELGVTKTASFTVTVTAAASADITWTAVQIGGTQDAVASTGIEFTFSAPIDSLNLTVANITVSGAAEKGPATFTGSGTTWTLTPINVNSQGNATVSINKTGIATASQNVPVYKVVLTDITASYTSPQPVYYDTPLDTLPLTITARYSDDSTKPLAASDCTISPPSYPGGLQVGSNNMYISYTEGSILKFYYFNLTVTAYEFASVTLYSEDDGLYAEFTQDPQQTASISGVSYQWYIFNQSESTWYYVDNTYTATYQPTKFGQYKVQVSATGYNPIDANNPVSPAALTFTDVETLIAALTEAEENDLTSPYNIKLNVSNDFSYINLPTNKYVNLDLSGSTFTSMNYIYSYSGDSIYLASIILPSSLTSIGSGTFNGCRNLTSITIPASVTEIADSSNSYGGAFKYCTSLTNVTFEAGSQLTKIGNYAFDGCTSLSNITIPANVTSIGEYAFNNCSSLSDITIPANVTSIGEYAFNNCSFLFSVTFEGTIDDGSFGNNSFPSSLRTTYLAPGGGPGTYTRPSGGYWTKQY